MEDKKSFFALLDSKSALILGGVGGLLSLCTLGFFVLLWMGMGGKVSLKGAQVAANNNVIAPAAQNGGNQPLPPPPTVPKTKKPKVELFVMSYCPFGLQMEKAYLPAWNLLKDKADVSVKFVSYAMHGKKEIDENTRQYCIGKEQPAKLISYLQCFVGKDDSGGCLKEAGVSESKVNSCMGATDKQFGITAKFDDQSTWLSGRYPIYPIHSDLNEKYGVQGSPTLVINGVEAQVGRTPEAVKQAICAGFENAPAECQQTLPNTGYGSGFGLALATGGASAAECGG